MMDGNMTPEKARDFALANLDQVVTNQELNQMFPMAALHIHPNSELYSNVGDWWYCNKMLWMENALRGDVNKEAHDQVLNRFIVHAVLWGWNHGGKETKDAISKQREQFV